ncbi:MAG: hypothetical protein K0U72_01630 [Gammaproteobacteria bacterium]|nr:hypothetical protein [Gammaproteobacteria bacterium]
MERVTFLLEDSNARIGCMLNPESLVLRRRAGVSTRQSAGGLVTGAELADDPIFFTGGGSTELTLDLLFDINLDGSTVDANDVRELTGPLWRLAENARRTGSDWRPAFALFFWGKAWAIRGVITAVAERLDYFTRDGIPQRAWLRLRMLRVADNVEDLAGGAIPPPIVDAEQMLESPPELPHGPSIVHDVQGDGAASVVGAGESDRLDQLAHRYYGDASLWRLLAWLNDINDPFHLSTGAAMQVPAQWDMESTQ